MRHWVNNYSDTYFFRFFEKNILFFFLKQTTETRNFVGSWESEIVFISNFIEHVVK